MVKIKRTLRPPASLAVEKAKAQGSYREPDVVYQLNQDFHGKCYLCEMNKLQSVEVEHLRPHNGDKEKMFDWNNLFLSCAHCNSVKNRKEYADKIIDCCIIDPEKVLNQQFINGHVEVLPIERKISGISETAKLLTECFEKRNTGIRTMECKVRIDALQETMTLLYKLLMQYRDNHNKKNYLALKGMLSRKYKFSGFTRTYVRNHLTDYPELADILDEKDNKDL